MIRLVLVTAVVATMLAGCATPGYECKKPLACNPVHTNYRDAVSDSGWSGWQAGGSDARTPSAKKGQPSEQLVAGRVRVPEGDALSGPVYQPPRPWRVWLAPYSRGDGTLESGTYVWFTTPGHWTYLGRQWTAPPYAVYAPDAGEPDDGGLHPVTPSDLGFTPGKSVAPQGVLNDMQQPNGDTP